MKPYLRDLALSVAKAIRLIDAEMKLPPSNERGKKIAAITNQLEFANDVALHLGLGYSFKKITKIKRGEK
ncbi:MAG: hypothetical protein WCY05_05175 [Candidatus Omnitrophota bacterium]